MIQKQKLNFLTFLLFVSIPLFSHSKAINVLTYSSMLDKGGLGESILQLAKKNSLDIKFQSSKDFAGILGQLRKNKRESSLSQIHLVLGISQAHYQSAIDEKLLLPGEKFEEATYSFLINKSLVKEKELPKSWAEIKTSFKNKILVQDPRSSEPGMAWLLNDQLSLEEKKSLPLKIFPNWSSSFDAFEKGLAPALWTYSTSAAYFACNEPEKLNKYSNLVLPQYPSDTNYAALSADIPEVLKGQAKQLLKLLISKEIQQEIWTRNWMTPAHATSLKLATPECYKKTWTPTQKSPLPVLNPKELLNLLDRWSL